MALFGLLVLLLAAVACGGSQSAGSGGSGSGSQGQPGSSQTIAVGTHSLADVKAALKAVGLTGLRPTPPDQIINGRGADPAKLFGGFSYFDTGDNGSLISIEVAVANDPSVFRPIKAAVVSQSKLGPYIPRFARAGNVLVFSTSDHPTASDRALLADIPKLVIYLNKQ